MSKARGLISGGDFATRTSGMYDSADNIRLSHISPAGFKKLGNKRFVLFETGQVSPQSFAWSPDGLHFYLAYSGDYIRHYECSTPFNLSGASEQATFNHSPWESTCYAIEVSPDGRYLYIGGLNRDTINQFTMVNQWQLYATANELLNPGYEQQNKRLDNIFSIGTNDNNVRGFDFNDDGTKFYLTGISDDNVQQFSLSTAYHVGTATYEGAYSLSGINAPTEVRWNNDGTKFFIVSYSPNDEVVEYSVSTAYDVTSTVTEETHFNVGSYDTLPMGVAFNADGTQMFVVGIGSDKVHEWTLSTGFDLSSTVTYVSGTSTGLTSPSHLEFNPAGTKLLVLNYDQYGNDLIRAYNLSTAFDSSTISDYETIDISTSRWAVSGVNGLSNQIVNPSGVRFNGDGTTVTMLDRHDSSYDKAVSIPLLTPYELSTYADGCIENSNTVFNYPCTFRFNPDGTKCYVLDVSDDRIYQYSLSKPYVLGRGSGVMTYDGMSSVFTNSDDVLRSFDFTPDGKAIYVCGSYQDTIAHYTVSVPFDVTSTLTLKDKIDTSSYFETEPMEIRVVNTFDGGYKLHFLGTGADDLFELDINF